MGHFLSLSILCLVIVTNYFIINNQFSKIKEVGIKTKQAIHQRNIAQRVSYLSLQIIDGDEVDTGSGKRLSHLVGMLKKTEGSFLDSSISYSDTRMAKAATKARAIYKRIMPSYDYLVAASMQLAANPLTDSVNYNQFIKSVSIFSNGMDAIVAQYDKQLEIASAQLNKIRLYCTLAILIILLLEVLFILRPIGHRITNYFAVIEEKNLALAQQNAALQSANTKVIATQEILEKLSTNVPGALYQYYEKEDGSKVFTYLSMGIEPIFEIEASAIFAEANLFLNAIHTDDLETYTNVCNYCKEHLVPKNIDLRIITKSGAEKWINMQSTPQRIGDTVIWHGYIQDITEKKEKEQALIESEAKFRTILHTTSNGFLFGKDKKLVIVNQAAADMFGYTIEEMLRKSREDLFATEDVVYKDFLKTRETSKKIRVELRGRRKNGELFHCAIHSVMNENNETVNFIVDITERKKLMEQLAKSEALLSQAESMAHVGSSEIDYATGKFYWSDEFYRIHGLEPQSFEPDATNSTHFLHPDDRYKIKLFDEAPLKKLETLTFESKIIRADGEIRNITTYWKITYNDAGEPLKMYGIVQDITERKALEDSLKKSEELFRSSFEYSVLGMAITDLEGNWIAVNQQLCDMVGYEKEAFLQLTFKDITHPDDIAEDLAQLIKARKGEIDSFTMEKRYFHKKGSIVWVLLVVSVVKDESGSPIQLFAQIENISQRKKAEFALANNRVRLQNILDSSPDIICTLSVNGHFVDVNGAAIRLWGYNPSELILHPLLDYILEEDHQKTIETFKAVINGVSTTNFENKYLHKNGSIIPMIWSMRLDSHSQLIYCNGRDATEIKKQETALENLNNELTVRANALIESNKELERFAYVASHDLQEPLRMVSSFLQLLQKRYAPQLDEKANEYIQFSVDGASRMKQLILDMLEYSRINTIADNFELIDLNELLGEVSLNLFSSIESTHAEVTLPKMPSVKGVRSQMMQLFQNLIGNAIKYRSKERNPIVKVEVLELDHEWEFTIKDNGIGISPRFYEKIFVIFQRLHNKESYSGTGIGLAICKKIVDKHGGRIWVESEEGVGSCFYFTVSK